MRSIDIRINEEDELAKHDGLFDSTLKSLILHYSTAIKDLSILNDSQLHTLQLIQSSDGSLSPETVKSLKNPLLRDLDLCSPSVMRPEDITDHHIRALSDLELERIGLHGWVSEDPLAAFQELSREKLKVVELHGCEGEFEELYNWLIQLPSMELVGFHDVGYDDNGEYRETPFPTWARTCDL